MDPYLEHPGLWPDVHNLLIAALRMQLAPVLRPRYVVRLEERTYLAEPQGLMLLGRPGVTVVRENADDGYEESGKTAIVVEVPMPDYVRETWLEVRNAGSGEVIAVVELLSPTNKAAGRGRKVYERKRERVLESQSHLVEIDLLRDGEPMALATPVDHCDYRILVSRGDRRPRAELFPFSVRDPIPSFRLPLRDGDAEPLVDVGAVLRNLCEQARYDLEIDYRADAVPPLRGDDAAWADALLKAASLR